MNWPIFLNIVGVFAIIAGISMISSNDYEGKSTRNGKIVLTLGAVIIGVGMGLMY